MQDLLPVMVAGVTSGATYALIALGLVIIFRSTGTVNFAIGDTGTLSVFIAISAMAAGAPVAVALLVAILSAAVIGMATERLLIRPLGSGHKSFFIALVVTIGLGLLIHAVIGAVWGYRPFIVPPLIAGNVQLFGVAISANKIAAALFAMLAIALVAAFFRYTLLGAAMRASAEDTFAARLVGIRPTAIAALAWAIGCGLVALATFFLAAETGANANLSTSALFRAFAGVFLGGLTSMPGAAIGGFVIGILDNLAGRYISANYRDTVVFGIIVIVLFAFPSGVLGKARKERV